MRIRLTVAYRGTSYAGWQAQPDQPTIQGSLQRIVAELIEDEVKVTGASRTDTGVHAAGQVCHFDSPKAIEPAKWQRSLNRMLPDDIRVLQAAAADDDFHARFSATGKIYRYYVDPRPVGSPFTAPFAWHRPRIKAHDDMVQAATALVGPMQQRVFAAQSAGGRELRTVDSFDVERGRLVTFTVRARSFMRHAIRGMVGSLLEVGYGRRAVDDLAAMAAAEVGHLPMVKAPPHGLCLLQVFYEPNPGRGDPGYRSVLDPSTSSG